MLFFYAWVALLLAIVISVPLVQFLENRKRKAAQAAAKPIASDGDMGMGIGDDMDGGMGMDDGMSMGDGMDDGMGDFGGDGGMSADFLDDSASPR